MFGRAIIVVSLVWVVACKGRTDEPAAEGVGSAVAKPVAAGGDAGVGGGDAAAAGPDEPALAIGPPARDLFAAIPAETPVLFATPEPIEAATWGRIAARIDGAALRASAAQRIEGAVDAVGKVEEAAWTELGAAIASGAAGRALGVAAAPRFAVYAVGAIPVVRVELAAPAVMQRAVGRVIAAAGAAAAARGPGMWIVEGGDAAVLIAVAGSQLVIARGPGAELKASAAAVVAGAAAPIDEAEVKKLAGRRGARAVGWIDPPRAAAVVASSRAAAGLDRRSPRCRQAVVELLAGLPRIALEGGEVAPGRLAVTAGFELPPAAAAAIAAASKAAPSLPAKLAGSPLIAASVVAVPEPAGAAWKARADQLARACPDGATPATLSLPAPWNTLEAGALVLYGGTWQGLLPSELDGFVGASAPRPEVIVAALRQRAPALAANPPKDGGGIVPMSVPSLGQLVPDLGIARRGNVVVAAAGPNGKAHLGELAVREPAPLFRLLVDLAAIRRRLAPPARTAPSDAEYFTARDGDADAPSPLADLVGALEIVAELAPAPAPAGGARVQLAIDLAEPRPATPAATAAADPRRPVRDQCRALLRKAFAATAPALAKLGVTTELDELARTYTTSIEASSVVRRCAELTPAARACLANAADPLVAAPRCAPSKDGWRPSAVELPPLFSFFGPKPLEARFHPPVDGAAVRARLVGTWVHTDPFGTETWQVDRAGQLVVTKTRKGEPATTERYRIEAKVAGELELHPLRTAKGDDDGEGGFERMSFFMPSADRFHLMTATPIGDEERFVGQLGDGFIVREGRACFVVTREGALVTATCEPRIDDRARTLVVRYREPCDGVPADPNDRCGREIGRTLRFFPGWVADGEAADASAFVRR